MVKRLLFFLLKIKGITAASIDIIDFSEQADKMIEDIIKKEGFVILNRHGEFYLKDFILLELIRDTKVRIIIKGASRTDNKEKKYIKEVRLKHDIDSVIEKKNVQLVVAAKVTGLQHMINYFKTI